jgi:hypothetical protein
MMNLHGRTVHNQSDTPARRGGHLTPVVKP